MKKIIFKNYRKNIQKHERYIYAFSFTMKLSVNFRNTLPVFSNACVN